MNQIRMHDQAPRQRRLDDRSIITSALKKTLGVLIAFVIAAAVFTLITPAATESFGPVGQTDFLVSPDMQNYMHKQGHGMIFNDMDMD